MKITFSKYKRTNRERLRRIIQEQIDGTDLRAKKFLKAYAICGNISQAAQIANKGRVNVKSGSTYSAFHYYRMKHDRKYRRQFEMAKEKYCDVLRSEVKRRAVDGWNEPVFWKGQKVAEVVRKSDTLLMFETKARMPEYRDRQPIDGASPRHLHLHKHDNEKIIVYMPDNGRAAALEGNRTVVIPAIGHENQSQTQTEKAG